MHRTIFIAGHTWFADVGMWIQVDFRFRPAGVDPGREQRPNRVVQRRLPPFLRPDICVGSWRKALFVPGTTTVHIEHGQAVAVSEVFYVKNMLKLIRRFVDRHDKAEGDGQQQIAQQNRQEPNRVRRAMSGHVS